MRTHGEYQLTDALMHLIEEGEAMTTCSVDNWFDCGRKETLLEANARLLNRPEFLDAREYPEFPDSVIIPPVCIGHGCQISKSIIGPNVAIGDKTIIENTILSNSIIGSYSELRAAVMHDCIVGSDASFRGLITRSISGTIRRLTIAKERAHTPKSRDDTEGSSLLFSGYSPITGARHRRGLFLNFQYCWFNCRCRLLRWSARRRCQNR